MQKVMTSYAMHFNKKYGRVGPLFVRPFKAKHIDTEPYYQHIFWYVHLNPLDLVERKWEERVIENPERARTFLNEYKWSSYYDYRARMPNAHISDRPESAILALDTLPDYIVMTDVLEDAIAQYCDTAYVTDTQNPQQKPLLE